MALNSMAMRSSSTAGSIPANLSLPTYAVATLGTCDHKTISALSTTTRAAKNTGQTPKRSFAFVFLPHWLALFFSSKSSPSLQLTPSGHLYPHTTLPQMPITGRSLYWQFDDRNPAFVYGPGWSNYTDVNAHDSTLSYTSEKTNVTIQFYGTLSMLPTPHAACH